MSLSIQCRIKCEANGTVAPVALSSRMYKTSINRSLAIYTYHHNNTKKLKLFCLLEHTNLTMCENLITMKKVVAFSDNGKDNLKK